MSTITFERNGFTLIELIATLLLVGFVGALILPFFYSGILGSARPINRVAENRELQTFVENALEYYFNPSNDYYGFQFIDDVQPLNSTTFSNGTDGPMQQFADWLDANWDSLEGDEKIQTLSANYTMVMPVEPFTSNDPVTPYESDRRVVRVEVEHVSGMSLVFFLGQDNAKNKQLRP